MSEGKIEVVPEVLRARRRSSADAPITRNMVCVNPGCESATIAEGAMEVAGGCSGKRCLVGLERRPGENAQFPGLVGP